MRKIEIECCEGNESYAWKCIQSRCPIYSKAATTVYQNWPRANSGFGNLYGHPTHEACLEQVRKDILNDKKSNPTEDAGEVI
jgi:hypothetical protein